MNEQRGGCPVGAVWSQRLWWAWAGLPAALVLGLLAVACLGGAPARLAGWGLQHQAVAQLYAAPGGWAGGWWSVLTLLGDTTVALMLLAPVAMWRPQAFMAVVASIPAGALVSVLGKLAFQVPRPSVTLDAHGLAQVALSAGHLNSFPSGHSITAFAIVAALAASLMRVPRRADERLVVASGLALALAVGASRVALGQHWPLDVLAGGLCGWLAGLHGAWLQRTRLAAWHHERVTRLKLQVLFALLAIDGAYLLLRAEDVPLARALLWLAPLLGLAGAARVYLRRTRAGVLPVGAGSPPLGIT